jgi:hypothetical protein
MCAVPAPVAEPRQKENVLQELQTRQALQKMSWQKEIGITAHF